MIAEPRRGWFQFSLSTLLLFVAALCVLPAVRAHRQHKRQAAIAKIDSLGGQIMYLSAWNRHPRSTSAFTLPEIGPLARLLGDDPDTMAIRVYLGDNSNVTDADLAYLLPLKELRILVVLNTAKTTDKGIAEIQKALPNCRVVKW